MSAEQEYYSRIRAALCFMKPGETTVGHFVSDIKMLQQIARESNQLLEI